MLRKLVNAGAIVESDGVFSLSGESPRQHSDFTARAESLAALGKNVPAVYQAIPPAGAVTLKELQATTGLSPAQLRYALEPLLDHAHVVMLGGQGQRTTTYRRT